MTFDTSISKPIDIPKVQLSTTNTYRNTLPEYIVEVLPSATWTTTSISTIKRPHGYLSKHQSGLFLYNAPLTEAKHQYEWSRQTFRLIVCHQWQGYKKQYWFQYWSKTFKKYKIPGQNEENSYLPRIVACLQHLHHWPPTFVPVLSPKSMSRRQTCEFTTNYTQKFCLCLLSCQLNTSRSYDIKECTVPHKSFANSTSGLGGGTLQHCPQRL